jgi:hypothetical protein
MGRGFGKVQPSSKGKEKSKSKLTEYTLLDLDRNGNVRVLRLMATCPNEATRKFNIYLELRDLYLSGASDEQLLAQMERNPL